MKGHKVENVFNIVENQMFIYYHLFRLKCFEYSVFEYFKACAFGLGRRL